MKKNGVLIYYVNQFELVLLTQVQPIRGTAVRHFPL